MKRCYMCTGVHDENGNFCKRCDKSINRAEEQEDEEIDVNTPPLVSIHMSTGGAMSVNVADGVESDKAIEMLREAIRIIKAFK